MKTMKMTTKTYVIVYLLMNILIFVLVLNNLTNNFVSVNVLLALLLGKSIGINNYAVLSLIYLPIITGVFYLIFRLIKTKYLMIFFLIIGLLVSLPFLNANGI